MKTGLAPLIALPPRASADLPSGTVALLPDGCSPRDGVAGVPVQSTLRVCALDADGDASDWAWQDVTIDGTAVTDLAGSPARMQVESSCGRRYLLVTPLQAFEPGSAHTLRCVYRNTVTLAEIPYVAAFTVTAGRSYTGTSPNSLERLVLTPCTHLLEVEPLRMILLDLALEHGRYGGAQDNARAARVLYQIAHGTDASSLLNPYGSFDAHALASVVDDRRTCFALLEALEPYSRRIDRALAQLTENGPVPPGLAIALVDGCDSALYTHRIAAICVMPFLARCIENAAAE